MRNRSGFSVRHGGSRNCRPTVATLVLTSLMAAVILWRPEAVMAQQRLHPALFALAAGDFPTGSHVVQSMVATNDVMLGEFPAHFGPPPAAVGRKTGYYMETERMDLSGQVHIRTSYLVSIFGSTHAAQRAYDYVWDCWFMSNYYTTPSLVTQKLGDHGSQALFRNFYPASPFSELFFRRGKVVVEVFESLSDRTEAANDTSALYQVATKLSALAREHPNGI